MRSRSHVYLTLALTLLGISLGLLVLIGFSLWLDAGRAYGAEPLRVDTFDRYSNRTGYVLIDPQTGRVDAFDKYSRRTGYGRITPAPAPPPVPPPPPSPPVFPTLCSRPPCR